MARDDGPMGVTVHTDDGNIVRRKESALQRPTPRPAGSHLARLTVPPSVVPARKRSDRRQTSMPIANPRAAQAKIDLAEQALAREQAAHAAATDSHAKAVAKVRVQRAQELLDRRKQEYRDKFS